jgi:hypothetical protein
LNFGPAASSATTTKLELFANVSESLFFGIENLRYLKLT